VSGDAEPSEDAFVAGAAAEVAGQLGPDAVVEGVEEVREPEMPPTVPQVAGGRREARERAVHLLYESRMKTRTGGETVAEQVAAPDPYAVEVVRGVEANRAEIDEIIGRLARGWTIDRMPSLDLEVLRVACFELGHRPDVPTGVVLSEAVELATRYGTDDSARFVNGLLAAAATELREA